MIVGVLLSILVAFPAADSGAGRETLVLDEMKAAEIVATDPEVRTESLARTFPLVPVRGKAYRLRVESPTRVHVDLRSLYFDAYLVIRDGSGSVVREDDDGLYGSHARIEMELVPDEEYLIEACATRGSTGAFELLVSRGEAPEMSARTRKRRTIQDLRRGLALIESERGAEHPDTATAAELLATHLLILGGLSESLPLFERAHAIRERALGPEHVLTIRALSNVGSILFPLRQFDRARSVEEKALALRRKALGPIHPDVAVSLQKLGNLCHAQGLDREALVHYREALEIFEELHGPDGDRIADVVNGIGTALLDLGQVAEARLQFERALRIDRKAGHIGELRFADHAENLARALQRMGEYEKALPLCREALRIRETRLGAGHSLTVVAVQNVANLYVTLGRADQAAALLRGALERRKKASRGAKQPEIARLQSSLGSVLQALGRQEEARFLFESSLAARQESLGEEHRETGISHINLGALLLRQGLVVRARPHLRMALDIFEAQRDPDPRYLERALLHWIDFLQLEGAVETSRQEIEQVLGQIENQRGQNHPDTIPFRLRLGEVVREQGDLAEARRHLERSLAAARVAFGESHPYLVACYEGLGRVDAVAKPAQAFRWYEQALELHTRNRGEVHASRVRVLNAMARLALDRGRRKEAEAHARSATSTAGTLADRILASQTEDERLSYVRELRETLDIFLSVGSEATSPDVTAERYRQVLLWKGKVSRSLFSGRSGERSLTEEQRTRFEELQAAQRCLAAELYRETIEDREEHERKLQALRERRSQEEWRLLRSLSPAGGDSNRTVDQGAKRGLERIRALLPDGAVLIDFLDHRAYEPADPEAGLPGSWGGRRLTAWVVTEKDLIEVNVGEVEKVRSAIEDYKQEILGARGVAIPGEGQGPASRHLLEILWSPVAAAVGEAELCLISPDSILGALPFEGLELSNGRYLLEKHRFAYGRDALAMLEHREPGGEPRGGLLLVGGIDYQGTNGSAPEAGSENRGSFRRRWAPLTATRGEISAIESLYDATFGEEAEKTVLTRIAATEARIKSEVAGNRFVHLATHGFFQPRGLASMWEEVARPDEAPEYRLRELEGSILEAHPGLLSGLVFAGANTPSAGEVEDGLLTADEATALDLSDCELVVLSACETGLGREESGEGLLGLRRSFRLAGARAVISSLWSVQDRATSRLMTSFYEHLWAGGHGRLEALTLAKLEMLKKNRIESGHGLPATWAGFVLDGDWR